jgi:CBS domain-containing protein
MEHCTRDRQRQFFSLTGRRYQPLLERATRTVSMPKLLVHDVMSISPVTVSPATLVPDLLARFDRHDFNILPVVDDRGRLVGVLSKLDVLGAFLGDGEAPAPVQQRIAATPADVLMTRDVIAVGPEDGLVAAGAIMVRAKLHSLPVTEHRDGQTSLLGIVSRGDILRGLRYRLEDAAAGPGSRP